MFIPPEVKKAVSHIDFILKINKKMYNNVFL